MVTQMVTIVMQMVTNGYNGYIFCKRAPTKPQHTLFI